MIRQAMENDAAVIAKIYNHYVLNTVFTFEEVGSKFNRWVDVGYWQLNLSA